MVKIERHPGIAERNFSGGYSDPNGQQRPCYYLPKREAELMVMSESLEVQTQVYDRSPLKSAREAHLSHGQGQMIVLSKPNKIYQSPCYF